MRPCVHAPTPSRISTLQEGAPTARRAKRRPAVDGGHDFGARRLRQAVVHHLVHFLLQLRGQPVPDRGSRVRDGEQLSISRMERPVLCACVGPQRTLLAPAGGWRCRSRPSGSGVAAVACFFIGLGHPLFTVVIYDGCCCVRHTLACRFVFVFPPTPLACPD